MFIFELLDMTDDEMYFPLGLFLSLEDAIAEIKKDSDDVGFKPPCVDSNDDAEKISLAVRKREVGSLDNGGKEVWEGCWTSEYDEESDSYIWKEFNLKT